MKKSSYLAAGLLALVLTPMLAQPVVPGSERPLTTKDLVSLTNSLPRFDLDFPGGTPKELVKAIEKATGRPLNAVIPDEYAALKICAIKVKNVTVPQLFEALKQASKKVERYMIDRPDNNWYFEERAAMYGFNTSGMPDENAIWYFYREGEPEAYQTISATVCHFYQLSPYLDAGYKVEDITTAIGTAWKMLGVTKAPEISYHKDTKVLIAVGGADNIRVIDNVLGQLSKRTPQEKSANGQPEKSKTE
jgi:hypothetical protein